MKIIFFNWRDITNPLAGGAEVYLHEIARRLSNNHEVALFCAKYKGCKGEDQIDGIRIIRRGGQFSVYLHGIFQYLLRLRKENYDVIVDSINGVPFFTPLFVRKPKIAIIHHLNKKDILFLELPFPLAAVAWTAEKLISFLYRRLAVVTVSSSSRQDLIEFGMSEDKIHIVYNSIAHSALGPGTKSEKPLVVYVGRIKQYKRLDHLVAAFQVVRRQISDAQLVIAGRGNYDKLREVIKASELQPYITLEGEVSEEEKAEILKRAWVFVTPSMKEGWGISVIEANACGTPAIAYDVLGLRDSVKDGETGLLVPDGKIEQLAEAIVELLSDSERRAGLSQNALGWASSFSWDRSAEEFTKILEGVIT
jgi:glycosyltransferase involved in cell wall biosynthesis